MWIILSLLAGLGDALRDTASKNCPDSIHPLLVSWSYSLLALPFVLPLLLSSTPEYLPAQFWGLIVLMGSIHVLGGVILVKALNANDLSLSIPLIAFSPVFLLFLGPLISGDSVSAIGIVGALLVAFGAYLINISKFKLGVLAPIKALAYQPGARGMLFLSFLWSITGSIDRFAIKTYPLTFWAPAQIVAVAILFIPVLIIKGQLFNIFSAKNLKLLFPIGAFNSLSFIPYVFALNTAPVQYVVCIKRTSILFSLYLGKAVFGESLLGEKILGVLMMFAGVVVITVFA
jgi:drug/metabolite transporter (DMT)-like permease